MFKKRVFFNKCRRSDKYYSCLIFNVRTNKTSLTVCPCRLTLEMHSKHTKILLVSKNRRLLGSVHDKTSCSHWHSLFICLSFVSASLLQGAAVTAEREENKEKENKTTSLHCAKLEKHNTHANNLVLQWIGRRVGGGAGVRGGGGAFEFRLFFFYRAAVCFPAPPGFLRSLQWSHCSTCSIQSASLKDTHTLRARK